jgi:D-beta-D-heptose 7-phosphate kinase/D-beta-D-heptose 1-phosphate adenosyltransferase
MQKTLAAKDLAAQLSRLRRQGKRIVFTNGCFDLLHPGHIFTLTQAKTFGDVLVVGINSDASVKRLKGEKRPILDQASRLALLAALEAVDYVTTFDEETPLTLIRALQPHILVKGGDWDPETIIGKEIVEKNGGRVVAVRYQDGFSSTDLIERIIAISQE